MGALFFEKNKLFYKKVLTNIYPYGKIYTEDKEREILNTRKGKKMTMTIDFLEKLNYAINNENAIKYMKGYELTNGKQVAQYEVTVIDIDIATAEATVFTEVNGEIKIEVLKRNQILYRTA